MKQLEEKKKKHTTWSNQDFIKLFSFDKIEEKSCTFKTPKYKLLRLDSFSGMDSNEVKPQCIDKTVHQSTSNSFNCFTTKNKKFQSPRSSNDGDNHYIDFKFASIKAIQDKIYNQNQIKKLDTVKYSKKNSKDSLNGKKPRPVENFISGKLSAKEIKNNLLDPLSRKKTSKDSNKKTEKVSTSTTLVKKNLNHKTGANVKTFSGKNHEFSIKSNQKIVSKPTDNQINKYESINKEIIENKEFDLNLIVQKDYIKKMQTPESAKKLDNKINLSSPDLFKKTTPIKNFNPFESDYKNPIELKLMDIIKNLNENSKISKNHALVNSSGSQSDEYFKELEVNLHPSSISNSLECFSSQENLDNKKFQLREPSFGLGGGEFTALSQKLQPKDLSDKPKSIKSIAKKSKISEKNTQTEIKPNSLNELMEMITDEKFMNGLKIIGKFAKFLNS